MPVTERAPPFDFQVRGTARAFVISAFFIAITSFPIQVPSQEHNEWNRLAK